MKRWVAMMAMTTIAALAWKQSTAAAPAPSPAASAPDGAKRVQVVFSGGHETDGRDRGRPVVLIAAALGVPEQVFRDAFKNVHPAQRNGGPTDAEARANKKVLMDALAPYGVTDERLNEVSNYYRYRRDRGELWPTQSAVAYALVKDGKITGFQITQGGSGYSSPPTVTVPGVESTPVATLSFGKDFDSNGAVSSIALGNTSK